VDYLVESILLPNAKIKEGFHGINVETKDDLEYSGILVRESGQEVVLRNAQNQEVSVAKSNIRKRANASQSLMPSGLLDTVSESDRNDLVAFLSRLGKAGDYDASKGGVARVWRVLPVTHRMDQGGWDKITKGDFTAKWTAMESGIGEHTWKPATSLVSGALAKADFGPNNIPPFVTLTSVFVATTFTLAKPGPVTLSIEGANTTDAWLNGNKAKVNTLGAKGALDLISQLPAGTHTVILRLDGAKLPESVRLKSTDVSWSLN
jgi:putative heme-binding domain-containing protein